MSVSHPYRWICVLYHPFRWIFVSERVPVSPFSFLSQIMLETANLPSGKCDSANWPNINPRCGSSQWPPPCEVKYKEVGFGMRVECAEQVKQENNNDCA